MKKEEIFEFINNYLKNHGSSSYHKLKNRYPAYLKVILELTNFFPEKPYRIKERFYAILNNIREMPKCEICGNSLKTIFNKTCSNECRKKYFYKILENGLTPAQMTSRKAAQTMKNRTDPKTGLSICQSIALKAAKTRTTRILDNGLTLAQNIGQKTRSTLLNKIDESGKNGYQQIAEKFSENMKNKVDEKGLNGFQQKSIKAAATMRSTVLNNGLTIYQNAGKKQKQTNYSNIDEFGRNEYDRNALKAAETMKTTILDNGLTIYQNSGKKVQTTQRNNIDEFGRDGYDRIAIKAAETMKSTIDGNGLNIYDKAKLKTIQTKITNIDDNGLNSIQRATQKMLKTMLKIDENGLNGFERAFKNRSGKAKLLMYKNTNLHYQGNQEFAFVETIEKFGLFHLLKNGPILKYVYKNETKRYHSDFSTLDNTNVVEVKAKWTYDENDKKLEDRIRNNLKWQAALKQCKRFFIVWDMKFLLEVFEDDFINIENDIYSLKDRFIPISKENLEKIFRVQEVLSSLIPA